MSAGVTGFSGGDKPRRRGLFIWFEATEKHVATAGFTPAEMTGMVGRDKPRRCCRFSRDRAPLTTTTNRRRKSGGRL